MAKVEVKVKDENELVDKIFISGFHGIGYVGWITVRHIIKSLKAKRLGFVYTPYMTPYVSMSEGIITPYEIYHARNIVVFIPNVPLSSREITSLPMRLAEFMVRKGVKEAILIGGLDSRVSDNKFKVKYAATSTYLRTRKNILKKLNMGKIEDYFYIVGPLAVMLSMFEIFEFPAITLLPYANVARPDPRAAAEAIRVLNKLLNLNIDVKDLLQEEERIEKEVKEIEERFKRAYGESKMLYV